MVFNKIFVSESSLSLFERQTIKNEEANDSTILIVCQTIFVCVYFFDFVVAFSENAFKRMEIFRFCLWLLIYALCAAFAIVCQSDPN